MADRETPIEAGAARAEGFDLALLRSVTGALASPPRDTDDTARIDLIRALEELKCAAEGAQAVLTSDLDASMRAQAAAAGKPRAQQGRGIAEQVAFARRESPHKGRQHTGLAKVLTTEMPNTLGALLGGKLSEWRATVLARETACLSQEHRQAVDVELAADVDRLEQMGTGELAAAARRLAARLDPANVAARRAKAAEDRRVTVRPAPDTMSWLTGHLPVAQGVAVYASLSAEADRLKLGGDRRTRGQIMADTLVQRVTGCQATEDGTPVIPLAVNVVIPAESLLAASEESGEILGYGPITAAEVRAWVRLGLDNDVEVSLRRLFTAPDTRQLASMESQASSFPGLIDHFVRLRDRRCRNPWCDAPIRHTDHVLAKVEGGLSTELNAQGLCESCNYAKQARGWTARPRPGPPHVVETRLPTGHIVVSSSPPAATSDGTRIRTVVLEIHHPMPEIDYVPDVA